MFWMVNNLKLSITMIRGALHVCKREFEWVKYVTCSWFESTNLAGLNLVYGAKKLWSKREYVGETHCGLENRAQRHINKKQNRKCKFTQFDHALKKDKPHTYVWYPLKGWQGEPTKKERMKCEGLVVFERQASLNVSGRSWTASFHTNQPEVLLTAKRTRYRPLLKFRKVMRKDFFAAPPDNVRQLQSHLMSLYQFVLRIARRPWKKSQNWKSFATVQTIIRMQISDIIRVAKLGTSLLSVTTKAIFVHNFKLVCSVLNNVKMVRLNISSQLLHVPGIERIVLQNMKNWLFQCKKNGVCVIASVNFLARSSDSILSMLDNTGAWSSRSYGQSICPCSQPEFSKALKLEGHVFQPLIHWIKTNNLIPIPNGWTVRSRVVP